MPYKLVKTATGGFRVENAETGKTFSKSPQTRTEALAQMRALYANAPDTRRRLKIKGDRRGP